jgi:hypothetical protein
MKSCLAVVGLFALLLLAAGAVLLLPYFSDEILLLTGDFGYPVDIGSGPTVPTVEARVAGGSPPVMTNLVEAAPTQAPTLIPTPEPTPTPLPDPVDYRARVMVRARLFSTALNAFMDTSNKLQSDANLMNDPAWRGEVSATLDEFVLATEGLSDAGTVPPEYLAVHGWLEQAGLEANNLRIYYLLGVESGDMARFESAGDSLNRLMEAMQQAELAMIAAGWQ